ncbi:hypothetical protein TeGR_g10162, partial [Tetraparma gracilis]
MPMLRNPLVLDALLPAAGSDIDRVSNRAIVCLYNLSRKSENRALMRDDVRIMEALTALMDTEGSKMVLFRICYIGDLPPYPYPTLDLSLFCSRPFHHQLSLCKALIREYPKQVKRKRGRAVLELARAEHFPAPIIRLISDCVSASAVAFSLTHLVGYKRSQIPLVRAQRHTLMCCLVHLANAPAPPAVEDSRGELNPGKALKGYLKGGMDPWADWRPQNYTTAHADRRLNTIYDDQSSAEIGSTENIDFAGIFSGTMENFLNAWLLAETLTPAVVLKNFVVFAAMGTVLIGGALMCIRGKYRDKYDGIRRKHRVQNERDEKEGMTSDRQKNEYILKQATPMFITYMDNMFM